MTRHILAIDQGTTGSTALLVSEQALVLARATFEFPQHFPQPGWVEHEPDEIWRSVEQAIQKAYASSDLKPQNCAAIGITNQRETTLLWDRKSGAPIHRAIVWQDRRTAERCNALRSQGRENTIRKQTGLVLDAYFSATKIEWLLDNVDGARAKADRGELAFGTIDTYLIHRLTGGSAHVTDTSNASRTLLFDIENGAFSESLASIFRVPMSVLPDVRGSAEVYGKTKGLGFLPDGIPISGVAGDQQAALFGQACFAEGEAKCTYGTGAFLLVNTGENLVRSEHGLVTTVAWTLNGKTTYALEGSAFVAGAAIQWLRDGLGIIQSSSEIEALATSVASSDGLYFVPALAGLGAPHWDGAARGLISGITRGHTKAHLARATLEGVALEVYDLARAAELDMKKKLARMRVDGGAAANRFMMQLTADLLQTPIDKPKNLESTAFGAAYLAGIGAGIFANKEQVQKVHQIEETLSPKPEDDVRARLIHGWNEAIARTKHHAPTPM